MGDVNFNPTPSRTICQPPAVYNAAEDVCEAEPLVIVGDPDAETNCIEGDTCYSAEELGFESNQALDTYKKANCDDSTMTFLPVQDSLDAEGNPLVIDICELKH